MERDKKVNGRGDLVEAVHSVEDLRERTAALMDELGRRVGASFGEEGRPQPLRAVAKASQKTRALVRNNRTAVAVVALVAAGVLILGRLWRPKRTPLSFLGRALLVLRATIRRVGAIRSARRQRLV